MGNQNIYPSCGSKETQTSKVCNQCESDFFEVKSQSDEHIEQQDKYILVSVDGDYRYEIDRNSVVIGRDYAMSEFLSRKPFVSRKHAMITISNKYLEIENLSKTNSTFINNKRLAVGECISLSDGDEIGLGGLVKDGQRQEDAAYFLVVIGEFNDFNTVKDKIILSENVKSLDDVRELLIRHYSLRAVFRDDIQCLVNILDSYVHSREAATEVIRKLFPPPQMAYDKFIGELADSDTALLKLMCKSADVIGITVKRSVKRNNILEKIKDDARALTELCDDLSTVLISKYGDDNNESTREIEVLLTDLQLLIESVINYY